MEKTLRDTIEKKISSLGLQKKYVANRIGLDAVRFSQTLAGKRKLSDLELTGLKNLLKF